MCVGGCVGVCVCVWVCVCVCVSTHPNTTLFYVPLCRSDSMLDFISSTVAYRFLLNICLFVCLFVFGRDSPPVDQGLLIHEVSISHTTRQHN